MRGWSFPLGRWFGVDLRVHTFFILLTGVCAAYANMLGLSSMRGFGLWFVVLFTVLFRELVRGIVAAYHGLQMRSILLLPTGGLVSYSNADSLERANEQRLQLQMAIIAPLASLSLGAILWLTILGMSPTLPVAVRPFVTPAHLIRSFVWLNLFLGLLNLVPAYPLDAGRVLRTYLSKTRGKEPAAKLASSIGQATGVVVFAAGVLLQSPLMIVAGFFVLMGAKLEDQGVLFQSVVDTVFMKDVMLTDFSMLSPSDTLEDALHKAIHSLQDDFPVVRGQNLVGIVSRQNIVEALRSDGNGYVQGVMQRAFPTAQPEDSLGATISRFAGRGMSLVPVTESGRIVGIVTLQNLMHSMGLLTESRRLRQRD
jgi:Zn-dependent protease/CBS domain-containing protein